MSIKETVTPCLDGYTIYINQNLDRTNQKKAYLHALRHIMGNDFEKFDFQKIEHLAHCSEEAYYETY